MLIDVAMLHTYRVCRHLSHDVGDVDLCECFRACSVGVLCRELNGNIEIHRDKYQKSPDPTKVRDGDSGEMFPTPP